MKKKDLLIIIPAYNEEKNIHKILDKLENPKIAEIADILVMNDASKDSTNWIAKKRGHTVITHVFNLGYGSALQLGYKYAIRRGYEYVIQMDADGQHDACNVAVIYEKLKYSNEQEKKPDIVLGSRFVEGSSPFQMSFIRRFACGLFSKMIYFATGKKIKDPTTGLQGLNRKTVLFYSKYNHFDDKYPDANMLMQMLLLGYQIEEVCAVMHQRTEGNSMHQGIIKPVLYMFRMMFSIFAVWIRIRILKIDVEIKDEVI